MSNPRLVYDSFHTDDSGFDFLPHGLDNSSPQLMPDLSPEHLYPRHGEARGAPSYLDSALPETASESPDFYVDQSNVLMATAVDFTDDFKSISMAKLNMGLTNNTAFPYTTTTSSNALFPDTLLGEIPHIPIPPSSLPLSLEGGGSIGGQRSPIEEPWNPLRQPIRRPSLTFNDTGSFGSPSTQPCTPAPMSSSSSVGSLPEGDDIFDRNFGAAIGLSSLDFDNAPLKHFSAAPVIGGPLDGSKPKTTPSLGAGAPSASSAVRARKPSESRISLPGLYDRMGLGNDHNEARIREQRILDLVKSKGFPMGEKTWIRDTKMSDRTAIIEHIYQQTHQDYGYSRELIELIIRRGLYYLMQGRLRRVRRAAATAALRRKKLGQQQERSNVVRQAVM